MRAVVQRVTHCEVTVGGETTGRIGSGLAVFLGVSSSDTKKEADYLADKVENLRIFADDNDKMNLSVKDVGREILVVSQFTLYGDARKGRRPSFTDAARPEQAEPLVKFFTEQLSQRGLRVESGVFGAMMQVNIQNDGPVTLMLER
jgi:D-tyrosyl-tRNA(Tyr) deacylase